VSAVKVAALYDVHGNLAALEAVMADPRLAGADVIVSGGDLVMGPFPAECLDVLEADGRVRFLRGNGDREVCDLDAEGELGEAARWCNERLGPERLERIQDWPATVAFDDSGIGRALFCHATPTSDLPILTRVTPDEDVARELGDVAAEVVVCGHTHVQYDRRVGSKRLVNAGSVGMPYEGSPDARWALLDAGGIELLSTAYDAAAAFDAISDAGFPLAEGWLRPVLLGRVTADEATDQFERRRRGA
jgi:predicted phosphodiesterase